VPWRPAPGGRGEPEVLLVHRTRYDDWSLPKGKREPGEYLPITAVREVREESGARITLGRRLRPVRYQTGGRPKRVDYWAARVTGTDDGAVPNHEADRAEWLPARLAAMRASYSRDIAVLEDFTTTSPDTVPLILLRHAKALPREGWHGDDAGRPLDETGRVDAKALAVLLACFAPAAHVVTSAAARCAETVRPYAELAGATVRPEPALQPSRTSSGDWSALIARAVAAGEPTVVCAHRENLSDLLAAALAALGAADVRVAGADRLEPLPPSGFWGLHMAEGRLAGVDRYDLSEALDGTSSSALARCSRRRRRTRHASQAASSTASAIST
jgi:8-oxo-(d)GTP phosphatase